MEGNDKQRIQKNKDLLSQCLTGYMYVEKIVDFLIRTKVFKQADYYKIAIENPEPLEKVARFLKHLQEVNSTEAYKNFCKALMENDLQHVLVQLNETEITQMRPNSGQLEEDREKQNMKLVENAGYVPARNTNFTGRMGELGRLDSTLQPGRLSRKLDGRRTRRYSLCNQVLTVHGSAGVGKSQLVLEYAHIHQDKYQLIYWIRCGNNSTDINMKGLASKLGIQVENVEEKDVTKRMYEILNMLDTYLLIFDYADDCNTTKYLPDNGDMKIGHHIIITAQVADRCRFPFKIEVFSDEDARTYVSSRLGDATHQDANENAMIDELAKILGFLPLALSQAVAYIKECHCGVNDYITNFKGMQTQIMKKHITFDNHPSRKSVFATLFTSIEKVMGRDPFFQPNYGADEAAATLIKCLAVLDSEEIPLSLFNRCELFHSRDMLNDAVRKLMRYALISKCQRKGHIRIHKLNQHVIREYKVQDLGDKLPEEFAEKILNPLTAAICKVLPDNCECISWIDVTKECLENLKEIVPHVQTLLSHIDEALKQQERYEENNEHGYSNVLGHLSTCKAKLLEVAGYSAYFRRDFPDAVKAFRDLIKLQDTKDGTTDDLTRAKSLQILGICERQVHRHDEAMRYFDRALEILTKQPNRRLEIAIMAAKAKTLFFMEELEEARNLLNRAIEMAKGHLSANDFRDLMSYIYPKLGNVEFKKGNFKEAEKHYQESLKIRKELYESGHILIGICRFGVAKTQMELKKYHESEMGFMKCLKSAKHHFDDNHSYVGKVHGALGKCFILQQRHDKAVPHLRSSLQNFARNYGEKSEIYQTILGWWRHAVASDSHPFEDDSFLFTLGF